MHWIFPLAERLQFGSEMAYNAMDAAEHLARYAMLRSICVGKRVLDVACGEGYGSYLLAQWGAASVTAVAGILDPVRPPCHNPFHAEHQQIRAIPPASLGG